MAHQGEWVPLIFTHGMNLKQIISVSLRNLIVSSMICTRILIYNYTYQNLHMQKHCTNTPQASQI
jgi:hypothetical protein